MAVIEATVTDPTRALMLDFVEWVATRPRNYAEVMEAWRTSCPRLTVWEDAIDRGFVVREHKVGIGNLVRATPIGLDLLKESGRMPDSIVSSERSETARKPTQGL